MVEQEKLKQAVDVIIAAGYQLNSEAFEFLSENSDTTDPVGIINLALERLSDLKEKPFFIEKAFLESLVQQHVAPVVETQPQQQQNASETPKIEEINSVDKTFYPHAKDIKSNFEILEDSTGRLSSNGTLEEYIEYL